MTSNSRLRLVRLGGVIALAGIIFAYFLPPSLEGLRTGHWEVEHFLAYFAAAFIVTLGWGHPWAVAAVFMVAAALLEALQGLTPNHSANLLSLLTGLGGTLVAVLLAKFVMGARLFRPGNRETEGRREDGGLLDARPQNHVGSAMSATKAAMARNWLAWILAALLVMVLYGRYTLGQTLTTLDQTLTKLCDLTQEALEWPTGERRPPSTSKTSDDNATSRSSAGVLAPWVERLIEQVAREHTQLASEDSLRGQLWRWQDANREQIEKICSERRGN